MFLLTFFVLPRNKSKDTRKFIKRNATYFLATLKIENITVYLDTVIYPLQYCFYNKEIHNRKRNMSRVN